MAYDDVAQDELSLTIQTWRTPLAPSGSAKVLYHKLGRSKQSLIADMFQTFDIQPFRRSQAQRFEQAADVKAYKNQEHELCEHPSHILFADFLVNGKVILSHLIYNMKRYDGVMLLSKARIAPHDDDDSQKLDFRVVCGICIPSGMRIHLALSVMRRWHNTKSDAKSAFLQRLISGSDVSLELGTVPHRPDHPQFFGMNISQDEDFSCSIDSNDELLSLEKYPVSGRQTREADIILDSAEISTFKSFNFSSAGLGYAGAQFCAFYPSYLQKDYQTYPFPNLFFKVVRVESSSSLSS